MEQRGMDARMEQSPTNEVVPNGYGGFWKRLLAYLVDWLVLVVIVVVVAVLGAILLVAGGASEGWAGPFGNVVGLIGGWFYYAFFESSAWQATPGKRLLGMKVVDRQGAQIGFWRATGRHFGKILSAFILLIGFLMIAFTRRKQGLHDIMASCLVVNRPPPPDKRYLA
ncbi:RDD family protein [Guyparkeria halophila]|uniref:RDD family protein n=1 Tax=Guyparkeria halophila TaxID=47960 RepID=A0ABZ0YU64_9GAMM|nr:RDD family protein [Guyparkeria halophila]WQH15533.1 RDD family protein [Guyparkeria halophila]